MAALWFKLPLQVLALERAPHGVRTGGLCHEERLRECGWVDVC